MTEPVAAVDVIEQALDGWIDDMLEDRVTRTQNDAIVAALREACGGGDIVIRTDGTLWRINDHPHHDYEWHLAPVERGA